MNLKKTKSEIRKYEKSEMDKQKEKIAQLDEQFNTLQKDYMEFYKRPFNALGEVLYIIIYFLKNQSYFNLGIDTKLNNRELGYSGIAPNPKKISITS